MHSNEYFSVFRITYLAERKLYFFRYLIITQLSKVLRPFPDESTTVISRLIYRGWKIGLLFSQINTVRYHLSTFCLQSRVNIVLTR